MDVHIIDIKTGRVAATVPIVLPEKTWIPSEQAFFAMAWQRAVDDKGVEASQRDDYSFRLVR